MLFENRMEAGQLLADRLMHLRHGAQPPIVLGIPRGGVVVAAEVARALGAPLGVVVTRKLGAPGNPELAIGAVAPDGGVVLHEAIARQSGAGPEYIEREKARQLVELRRRQEAFGGLRQLSELAGRTVILVDDGIATGATTKAALQWLRRARPERLVLAVPVAAGDSLASLEEDADEVISLATPEPFWSVGSSYRDWPQVSDEEVKRLVSAYGGDS